MQLDNLISKFYESDAKLRASIHSGGSETELSEQDLVTQEVLHAIREYKPEGYHELKSKLQFFIDRLRSDIANVSDAFSVDSLIHILEKDFLISHFRTFAPDGVSENESESFKLVNAFDLVSNSNDRISIIDKNYRYVQTSWRNSEYYHKQPDAMIGAHVGQMIGQLRFEERARRFFDNCFDGGKQDYFHSLFADRRKRIMSCQMTPLYNNDASVFGALVAMNDVTEMISDPNSVVLQEIDQASMV